ncbi:MAG: ABC-2 transporter permease [Acidobacteriota bacterium]|jgi:hypothetical protein
MLPDLILRDWKLHRRALLPMMAIFAIFQVYFVLRVDSTTFWLVFTCVYAMGLTIMPLAREDKFGSTAWTCTLPVTRAQIIGARFVEAWLLALAWIAVSTLMAVLIPGSRIAVESLAEPATILLAVTIITVILSLLLPFTIRFGILGVLIVGVAAQILGTVVLLVLVLTRGRRTAGANPIDIVIGAVRDGITFVHGALPPVAFYLLVLAALAALHWAAYRSAIVLFDRKEL